MRSTVFLLTLLFFATCCQEPIPQFKNVVVILADDHALGVTGIYGNDIVRTPSIDRLANEGITFTRAYCNSPICSASRQSLLTGKYPHATGVNLLFTPFPDEQNTTIAEHLRDRGYQTAIVGKTHWNNWAWASLYKNGLPDHGFDVIVENGEYRSFLAEDPPPLLPDSIEYYSRSIERENTGEWMNYCALPHPIDDAHSSGTFFAGEAVKFIESNKEKPFFLWLAFKEPHHPYYFPLDYAGKYNPEEMPLPQGSPEDDRWIPEKFRDLTDEEKRGIIAAYYTSTEYMDKNVGLVLDQINRLGLEENTLVVYISDNGYLLNEHKRFEKHTMWEEAVRQPMIVKAHKSAGQKSEVLVEYIDVMPTVLDYLGIESPPAVQGLSFKNVIENGEQDFREYVFAEYLEDNLAMIRNEQWKYVFTTGSRDLGIGYKTGFGPSGIVHRLYDLENNPMENHSLADERPEILHQMQRIMLEKFMKTHPDAEDCPEGLTLEGKLVWFCEPRDIGTDQSPEDVPVRVFENNLD